MKVKGLPRIDYCIGVLIRALPVSFVFPNILLGATFNKLLAAVLWPNPDVTEVSSGPRLYR
jgi:hypothetical protein